MRFLTPPAGCIAIWLLDRVSLLTYYYEDYSIGAVVIGIEKVATVIQY
jgi:hypothetical protein